MLYNWQNLVMQLHEREPVEKVEQEGVLAHLNLADIRIDPPERWIEYEQSEDYARAHNERVRSVSYMQEYVLDGLGIEVVRDAERSVLFSPMGSTEATSALISRVKILESERKYMIVPPLGYPSGRKWAEDNGLMFQSAFSQGEEKEVVFAEGDFNKAFVAIDYPNNPTGQTFPDVLRTSIDHISAKGGRMIVDLAFGEFLAGTECRDLMNFTLARGGIVCISMSKFLGGVGQGIVIIPDELVEMGVDARKLRVFRLDGRDAAVDNFLFERKADEAVCTAARHLQGVGDKLEKEKPKVIEALQGIGLQVYPTDMRTPIMVVQSQTPHFMVNLKAQNVSVLDLGRFDNTISADDKHHADTSAVRIFIKPSLDIKDLSSRFLAASQS